MDDDAVMFSCEFEISLSSHFYTRDVVLIDPGSSSIQQQCAADLHLDGAIDLQDLDDFVSLLLSS